MDIWFDGYPDPQSRRGTTIYSVGSDGLRAVTRMPRTYPDDLSAETADLLGTYGVTVGGVGAQLVDDGIDLPRGALYQWSTSRDRPAAELGDWQPGLLLMNGHAIIALILELDANTRVSATTLYDEHLVILSPPRTDPIAVSARTEFTSPPFGWDQRGGQT